MITDSRVDRTTLNNGFKKCFRKALVGMPSSSLPFRCKRARKEILIRIAVRVVCIYFSHAGLNTCKGWDHREYGLNIHWYASEGHDVERIHFIEWTTRKYFKLFGVCSKKCIPNL